MAVRYAIRCGTCRTAVPLLGQDLLALSSEAVGFMAAHEHVNPDFAVVPMPTAVPAPRTPSPVDCDEKWVSKAG